MLQQTRVDSVIPYFARWMRRFPNVKSLASASEREVLSAWEGLGYYARARNLRRAAQLIVRSYGGHLPATPDALKALPGVGRYTAGAIASIAFGLDEPVLDGNVRRVLSRLFDLHVPADGARGRRRLWELAREHLPSGKAADYNQALMDLGATICLPRNPRCAECPVRTSCVSLRRGTVNRRPVLRRRRPTPLYHLGAAVVVSRRRVLLAHRDSRALLGGLWEFPNTRLVSSGADRAVVRSLVAGLEDGYGLRVQPDGLLGDVKHAYTHFRVAVQARTCRLIASKPPALRWAKVTELSTYPMGKVDRAIARMIAASSIDGVPNLGS